mgnify:CR=1 FL=1
MSKYVKSILNKHLSTADSSALVQQYIINWAQEELLLQKAELNVDISYGDYIGYYETEDRVRYYSVVNDGRVVSDNKHTYGGYKPFYRSIIAAPVNDGEFRGI